MIVESSMRISHETLHDHGSLARLRKDPAVHPQDSDSNDVEVSIEGLMQSPPCRSHGVRLALRFAFGRIEATFCSTLITSTVATLCNSTTARVSVVTLRSTPCMGAPLSFTRPRPPPSEVTFSKVFVMVSRVVLGSLS